MDRPEYTFASLDRIIESGRPFPDWRKLCRVAIDDLMVFRKLKRVALSRHNRPNYTPTAAALYERWARWCEKQARIDAILMREAEKAGMVGVWHSRATLVRQLAERNGSFIPKGVYRYKTPDDADRHQQECIAAGIARLTRI